MNRGWFLLCNKRAVIVVRDVIVVVTAALLMQFLKLSKHGSTLVNVVHCAFVIDNFFKNNELITITPILFRIHFNVARHGAIPGQITIVRWISNFQNTASA